MTPPGDASLPGIRIDAVVTDRTGHPVLDLRPSDFELMIDGHVRPLASVALRGPHTPGVASTLAADDTAPEERQGGRVFAFVLDEFHVGPGVETERVRDGVTRFIDEHLRPADRAVVLKPLDQVNAIRFSPDRQPLRDAVASFAGRKGDFTPRSAFEQQFIGHAPETVAAARVQLMTAALNELAMQLGELDAERAAIVFFSEGFARSAPVRRGSRVLDLQGLLRAASRFHFPVYAFNPADPPAARAGDAPDPASATLQWLAAETGGASVLDGRRLSAGLQRMSGELDAYYSLTLPAGITDGRFHTIDLRAKRAGVSVRVRPGYWAPLSSELREWLRKSNDSPAAPRRALKRSALIDAWVGLVPGSGGQRQMVVTWEPTLRRSVSRERAEPVHVQLTARAAGTTLFHGTLGHGTEADSPRAARFDVPAGRVEIDMRILGAGGALLDSDVRDLTVPDMAGANATIVLSPQIIRTRTMNEFRAATTDAEALPTNARTFSRSDRLVIRVPSWAPGGESVRTGVRVLNRTGQPIRPVERSGSVAGSSQFELPLYWLAPGDYYLEFSGRTDRLESRERLAIKVTR